MIEFKNLNKEIPYQLLKEKYDEALDEGQKGIEAISLLGSEEPINWKITEAGLEISLPSKKPCDIAYSFKITPKGKLVNFDRD